MLYRRLSKLLTCSSVTPQVGRVGSKELADNKGGRQRRRGGGFRQVWLQGEGQCSKRGSKLKFSLFSFFFFYSNCMMDLKIKLQGMCTVTPSDWMLWRTFPERVCFPTRRIITPFKSYTSNHGGRKVKKQATHEILSRTFWEAEEERTKVEPSAVFGLLMYKWEELQTKYIRSWRWPRSWTNTEHNGREDEEEY